MHGRGSNNINLWTVEQQGAGFKHYRKVSLSGKKTELVNEISDIIATDGLQRENEALPSQMVDFP